MATCFCTGACRDGRGCSVTGRGVRTVNDVIDAARAIEANYPVRGLRDPWREPRDYGTRTCPLCEGKGLNPQMKWLTCPKCKGERKVPS